MGVKAKLISTFGGSHPGGVLVPRQGTGRHGDPSSEALLSSRTEGPKALMAQEMTVPKILRMLTLKIWETRAVMWEVAA